MARRIYTEMDQARVAVLLKANKGNLTRTARETNIPKATVQDWKRKWEMEGYPDPVEAALPAAREDIVSDYKRIVKLAAEQVIKELEAGNVKAKDAAWIAGLFHDKLSVIEGEPTSRKEVVHTLPDASELARELALQVTEAVESAQRRSDEITDAVYWEQSPLELPVSA